MSANLDAAAIRDAIRRDVARVAAGAETSNFDDVEPAPHDNGGELKILTVADVLAMPRESWLVKGVIGAGRLSIWFGPPGCGKSFLLMHVAACIVSDRSVFGRRVSAGLVVYVAGEGAGGFRVRLAALVQAGLLDKDATFRLVPFALDLASDQADTNRLLTAIKRLGSPVLIVVDTVARSLGGADEDAQAFGHLIRACDTIRQTTGAHVALVHHAGKDAARGPRGHSSLIGAADTVIELSRDGHERTAEIVKQRDGREGDWLTFRLQLVEVDRDEDGEPETSCIVVDAGADRAAKKRKKPGGQAGIALTALENLFAKNAGNPAPYSPDIPNGVQIVPVTLWREAALGAGLCETGAKEETRRKAFHRSKVALISSGHVGCREVGGEELAWIVGHVRDKSGTCDADSGGTDRDNTLRGVPSVPVPADMNGGSSHGLAPWELSK